MRSLVLSALLLAALPALAEKPEFDFDRGGAWAAPAAAPAPSPKAVEMRWITTDAATALAADPLMGAPLSAGPAAALYAVSPSAVTQFSHRVHTQLHRCGGFLAHDTMQDALAAIKAPPRAPAFSAPALDQAAFLAPLAASASETEIRKTITALSAYTDRRFDTADGAAAASWIKSKWGSLAAGIPGARADLFAHKRWTQPSVILTIPGASKPDEIVVLGGHLDSTSWSLGPTGRPTAAGSAPGADDNASGIAVLTEALRLLAASGFRPARTVQFMGYAAEEVGLLGSQEIATAYAGAGKQVKAVIQFDMTNFKGSGDAIYLLDDNVDPALTAFLEKLVTAYAGVPAKRTRCGYGCSDHASWSRRGFPASAAFESDVRAMNPSIHTPGDTLAASGGTAAHSVPFARLAAAFAVETAKR